MFLLSCKHYAISCMAYGSQHTFYIVRLIFQAFSEEKRKAIQSLVSLLLSAARFFICAWLLLFESLPLLLSTHLPHKLVCSVGCCLCTEDGLLLHSATIRKVI